MNTALENPPWLTSKSYKFIIENSTNKALKHFPLSDERLMILLRDLP